MLTRVWAKVEQHPLLCGIGFTNACMAGSDLARGHYLLAGIVAAISLGCLLMASKD